MFKGIVNTDTTVASNTNVPFTVVRNTNQNTDYNATTDVVEFNTSGYYDIIGTIVATTTTAATVSARLMVNGNAVSGAVSTEDLGANTPSTFTLVDNEKVVPNYGTKANVSVQFDSPVTVNDAVLIVENVR